MMTVVGTPLPEPIEAGRVDASSPRCATRGIRLALLGLVLFLLGWDLWAILLDQRLKLPDTFVMHTIQLEQALEQGALTAWLSNLGPKGPLPPVLALPFLLVLGIAPLSMSLVTVLGHAGLTVQTYDLGRRLSGKPLAGLFAALLLGTCPFIVGISRLSYHDVLLGNAVIGAMQLMLRVRLDRARPAFALGVVLGAGLLIKHSFPLYMAGPALWFLARRVRGVRHLVGLAIMALPMVGLGAIWAWPNLPAVLENLFANTSLPDVPLSAELGFYLGLPGALPLFVLAMASALWLPWVRRLGFWDLALLFTFVPMMAGLHQVTAAARYLVPIVPLWAVLCGCGLAWLVEKLPRQPALGLGGAVLALSLGALVVINLRGIEPPPGVPREDFGGILTPETRPHDGFRRAMAALSPQGSEVFLIYDSVMAYCEKMDHEVLWDYRGTPITPIFEDRVQERLARGQGVSVLFVRQHPEQPLSDPPLPELWPPVAPGEHSSLALLSRRVSWLYQQDRRRLVQRTRDPDGVVFEAYRIGPDEQKPAEAAIRP